MTKNNLDLTNQDKETNENDDKNLNNFYNFNLICTYEKIKDFDESEILYRIQFLQLFKINSFDELVINKITILLFDNFKENKLIDNLLSNSSFNDKGTAFRMFFAYPTLYMFQKLISEIYFNKNIDENNYNQLINFAKTNY